jgi:hypothetical protein
MFALFALLFLMVKIRILALAYATLVVIVLLIFSKKARQDWRIMSLGKKFLFWFGCSFLLFIALSIYAFSYWGYSGLGDEACIPVGNGFVVYSIDALESSWIEPDRKEDWKQAELQNFALSKDHVLCAEFTGYNGENCNHCFIVFDTNTQKITVFNSQAEYYEFARTNNLPQHDEFKSFIENYRAHWGGLRQYLLP